MGCLQDTGTPDYRPQWDLVNLEGRQDAAAGPGRTPGAQTFARNPAHPEVRQWYHDYLAALLRSFGPVVDGFVWDETFYVRAGTIALQPQPAYCDRAMMQLVKSLTAQVRAADPQKVVSGVRLHPFARACPEAGHDPRLRPGGRRDLSGHRLRADGLVLRAISQLAQHAMELQLGLGFALRLDAVRRRALRRSGGDFQRLVGRPGAVGVDRPRARADSAAVPLAVGAEPRPLSDRRPAEGPAHRPQGGVKRDATCGSESCGRFGFGEHENTSPEWIDRLFGKDVPEEIKKFNRDGIMFIGEKGRLAVNRGGIHGKFVDNLKQSPDGKNWLVAEVAKLYRGKPLRGHMANIAMLVGRKIRWDPARQEFIGDDEANAWQTRPQRAPYTIEG